MRRALALFLVFFLAGFCLVALLTEPRTTGGADAALSSDPWAALGDGGSQERCSRCRDGRTEASGAAALAAKSKRRERAKEAPASKEKGARAATLVFDLRCRGQSWAQEAEVNLRDARSELRRTWTPTRRRFVVEPGSYRIGIKAGALDWTHIEVQAAAGQTLERVVEIEASIRGRLTIPEGYWESATLIAAPLESWPRSRVRVRSKGHVLTNGSTSYAFPSLAPGTYQIAFTPDGHCVEELAVVEVAGELVNLDLELPAVRAERRIALEVYEPGGGRCEGVRWEVRTMDGREVLFRTLEDGRALTLCCRRVNPRERLWLEGWHEEYGGQTVGFSSRDRRLVLRYAAPAELSVRVPAFQGLSPGASLFVSWSGWGRGHSSGEARVVPPGVALVENISPGFGRLTIQSQDTLLVSRRLELSSGPQSLEIEAVRCGRLEVWAPDHPGAYASIESPLGAGFKELSMDGRAVFESVPHGRYEVKVGDTTRWATVPGSPVLIRRGETRCWRVRIEDSAGALARLGFQDGDQILAVGDRPISDASTLNEVGGGRVRLRRSGGVLELPIRLDLLNSEPFLKGGRVEVWRED